MKGFNITEFFQSIQLATVIRIAVLLFLGIPLFKILSSLTARIFKKKFSPQAAMIVKKTIFYSGSIIIIIMVLKELGFNLTALLGAAGIAGVALGFASQTSVSNIISGLFLIGEKPFIVGDFIRVGDKSGTVISIDLLSVKIRTLDNLFVRLPNESLIKQELINITKYPIRRMDIMIGVAYKEDIGRVMKILKELAQGNPFCLEDPEPLILFKDFGDSALEIQFGVWFAKSDYVKLRNSIMKEIKDRFDHEKIEIPYPQISIHSSNKPGPPQSKP